jgi:outer membrane biosynthesis protein TonB
MKKVIIIAVTLMVSVAAFAQTNSTKSNAKFQRYISKNIAYHTSHATDGIQGTVKVEVKFSENSIDAILISGIDPKLDEQVVAMIKRTPSKIVQGMIDEKQTSIIVPVKFVINEN